MIGGRKREMTMNKKPEDQASRQLMNNAQFRAAVQRAKEHFHEITELNKLKAKAYRSMYDELIRQGFTEAQALELCANGWPQ